MLSAGVVEDDIETSLSRRLCAAQPDARDARRFQCWRRLRVVCLTAQGVNSSPLPSRSPALRLSAVTSAGHIAAVAGLVSVASPGSPLHGETRMNQFTKGPVVVLGPDEGESFWQPLPSR